MGGLPLAAFGPSADMLRHRKLPKKRVSKHGLDKYFQPIVSTHGLKNGIGKRSKLYLYRMVSNVGVSQWFQTMVLENGFNKYSQKLVSGNENYLGETRVGNGHTEGRRN